VVREKANVFFDEATGPVDRDSLVAMPRPPRLQYEGALYRAYTRGNHREVTFRNETSVGSGLWTITQFASLTRGKK
jgi:hypothetical protein